MAEPCSRCGASHEGACPLENADLPGAVEACPFCGEAHSREYTCGEWAKLTAGRTADPWGAGGSSALSARPTISLEPRPPRARWLSLNTPAVRVLLVCLAVFGAVELVLIVGGHFSSAGSGSVASLPSCTHERVRQNLIRATTIEASGSAVPQRIDATNALLLSSGDGCTAQLLMLYTAYIEYQTLCLELPTSGACKSRDDAHAAITQTVSEPQF